MKRLKPFLSFRPRTTRLKPGANERRIFSLQESEMRTSQSCAYVFDCQNQHAAVQVLHGARRLLTPSRRPAWLRVDRLLGAETFRQRMGAEHDGAERTETAAA